MSLRAIQLLLRRKRALGSDGLGALRVAIESPPFILAQWIAVYDKPRGVSFDPLLNGCKPRLSPTLGHVKSN